VNAEGQARRYCGRIVERRDQVLIGPHRRQPARLPAFFNTLRSTKRFLQTEQLIWPLPLASWRDATG
jgi:hypothetical protein